MTRLQKYIYITSSVSIFLVFGVSNVSHLQSISLLHHENDCKDDIIAPAATASINARKNNRSHRDGVRLIADVEAVADIQDDLEYCSKNNFVERKFKMRFKNPAIRRPYSIRLGDFGINKEEEDDITTTSIINQSQQRQPCSTVNQLIHAIDFGQRYWDGNTLAVENDRSRGDQSSSTLLEKKPKQRRRKWIGEVLPDYNNISAWLDIEKVPSTFVPHQCDIPRLTSSRICDIINSFSNIVLLGDSLLRHVQNGLWMGLRNNLVNGGIVSDNLLAYHCRCDGQFSENKQCRNHSTIFANFVPYQQNLCPRLDPENQVRVIYHNSPFGGPYDFGDSGNSTTTTTTSVDCTERANRGLLLILQGGLHFQTNATATFDKVVLETLSHPIVQTCAQQKKLYVIWNGYNAHSPRTTQKYPHQNYTNALQFNSNIETLFQQTYGEGSNNGPPRKGSAQRKHNQRKIEDVDQMIGMINWMNFTQAAQTSDGMHYLSQVNYLKAQYILHLAELMKKEKRTFQYY